MDAVLNVDARLLQKSSTVTEQRPAVLLVSRDPGLLRSRHMIVSLAGALSIPVQDAEGVGSALQGAVVFAVVLCHTLTSIEQEEVEQLVRAHSSETDILKLINGNARPSDIYLFARNAVLRCRAV